MFKFLLSVFLVLLCQSHAQEDRFIALVQEFVSGYLGTAVERCPGTIITNRHLLTTAACATPTNSSLVIGVDVWIIYPGGGGWNRIPADQVFIHPNYTGDVFSNNVAVVQLDGTCNAWLPPRTLGSITTNSTCTLFVRGGRLDVAETVEVQVYGSQFCDSSLPQAYCSEVSVPSARACEAFPGSPLVCNAQSVSGIFLQTGCREISPGRYLLAYHSVSDFQDWIESVSWTDSSAELRSKISVIFLLSAVIIGSKNLF